jgi:excinuclease ABC subunit A
MLMVGSGDRQIPFTAHENGRTIKKMRPFEGIIPQLQQQHAQAVSAAEKKSLEGYMAETACPHCNGSACGRRAAISKSMAGPLGI